MDRTDLTTLTVGDRCWMLNGMKNRSFLCMVTAIEDGVITVANVDKANKEFSFKVDTGEPAGDYYVAFGSATPTVVPYTDKHAQSLDVERVHRGYREDIGQLLADMPENRDGYDKAIALLQEWRGVEVV